MGLPRKQTFTYQRRASFAGNLHRGKFLEQIWYKVIVEHQDTFTVVQTQHRLVQQDPSKLVADQTQHRLVDQVQDKFGIAGITVVDAVIAMVVDLMVVSHQCKINQVMNTLNQCKSDSFQYMVNWAEVVGV